MFGGLRNIKFSKTQSFSELLNNDLRRSSTRLEDYYLNESTTQSGFLEKKNSPTRNKVNEIDYELQIDSNNKGTFTILIYGYGHLHY